MSTTLFGKTHATTPGQAADAAAPPPVVTTNLGYTFLNQYLDGYLTAPFQGYDPAVTGQLTLAIGGTAYQTPSTVAALAPLQHVQAATPVLDATSLIDLAFQTPGQNYGLGAELPSNTDVGISATTAGLSAILGPLSTALAGTTLGNELAPIDSFTKGLLKSFNRNGGVPHGGSLTAKPYLALNAGVGLTSAVTVLGHTTTTSQGGSLTVNGHTGAQAVQTLTDTAGLLSNAGTLLSDVQSGNLLGAVPAGVATLASGASLIGDAGALIAAGAGQHPVLPAIKNPALNLNLQTGAAQTFGLGLTDPATLSETVGVNITADTFGAYALGKLLAQIAPQLITDLQDQNTVRQPLDVLSQLATGVSTLAKDASQGFAGLGGAGAVPSSTTRPDISIQLTLTTNETQNTIAGSISNTQTFTTNLETNAQGFYDLGTAAQPAITDLLVGLLETPGGKEALQIGGDILTQLDQKLGGGSAASAGLPSSHPIGIMHGAAVLADWHH